MPFWLQYLTWAAAAVVALGVLWTKVVQPIFRKATRADKLVDALVRVERMLPALTVIADEFDGVASLLPTVKAMALEFKSDSGSTLKDQMNDMEKAVTRLNVAVARIEAGDLVVATNLGVAQRAVEGVATDLAASHDRADRIGNDHPSGTASDAAQRSEPKERDK